MKLLRIVAFSLGVSLTGLVGLPALAQGDSTSNPNRELFTVVEQHPEFPGGMRQLGEYIKKNLRYPEAARQAKREGRAFVTFIVTDRGHIEEVRTLNKLGSGMDEEAVRLIQTMPDWIPGKQNGRAVYVRYNLPVNFSLR